MTKEEHGEFDPLQMFLSQIKRYPLLDPDQETILFDRLDSSSSLKKLRRDREFLETVDPRDQEKFNNVLDDSKEIDDILVLCNTRLIVSIATKYQGRGLPLMDLIQEGVFGLEKAIEGYDLETGNAFSTYATWWIRQSITRAISNTGRMVRLPVGVGDAVNKAIFLASEFYGKYRRDLAPDELRQQLLDNTNIPEGNINNALEALHAGVLNVVTYDAPIGDDDNTPLIDLLAQTVPDQSSEDTQDSPVNPNIAIGLEVLSPIEREVVEYRFGFNGKSPSTLAEIGNVKGYTRQGINLIEKRALAKIKTRLEELRGSQKLEVRLEDDVPKSFYTTSAERAAFKEGLVKS